MSETLKLNNSNDEPGSMELRFPEDPNQYSEEELMADPAKRFHVNPKDFPIFSRQAEMGPEWKSPLETLPLDETMGRFVKATADCIAVLTGEDEGAYSIKELPAADYIVYLDKSARPVSWLNNVFWDAFTDKPRPKHSYLAIDRIEWFHRTGTLVDANGYVESPDGKTKYVATFEDFKRQNVTDEDIARIRALFIPGGIEDEDIEKIMNTPTGLEGKNITIVDEVGRSGSTLDISKYLISRAIPEAASVNGYIYWNAGVQVGPNNERQMRGVPVWYDPHSRVGRGIGDIDEGYFEKRYENYPNPKTRAQKYGAIALGAFVNLDEEPGHKSRQLAKEIKIMRKEWDAGHIMMPMPEHYSEEKWIERLEAQGIQFMPQQPNMPKNAYLRIKEEIDSRPPELM